VNFTHKFSKFTKSDIWRVIQGCVVSYVLKGDKIVEKTIDNS